VEEIRLDGDAPQEVEAGAQLPAETATPAPSPDPNPPAEAPGYAPIDPADPAAVAAALHAHSQALTRMEGQVIWTNQQLAWLVAQVHGAMGALAQSPMGATLGRMFKKG
jgi:hypothetical protein